MGHLLPAALTVGCTWVLSCRRKELYLQRWSKSDHNPNPLRVKSQFLISVAKNAGFQPLTTERWLWALGRGVNNSVLISVV